MTRAPYCTVDMLVLRVDPSQVCSVVENQQAGDTHVMIWRSGQPAPERVRNEDVMLLSERKIREQGHE